MAKTSFLDFLLAKGDKIALGVGGVGFGLLGVWGVSTMFGAPSPAEVVKELKTGTSNIQSKLNDTNGKPADLPDVFTKGGLKFEPLPPEDFKAQYLAFEPVDMPSKLRENPAVLGITDAQLDLVRLPMKAFDIRQGQDGATIGVLTKVNIGKNDTAVLKEINGRKKKDFKAAHPPAPPPGMSGPPGMSAPPGMMSGRPGMSGPPGMGAPPGMSGPPPGEGGPGMGGMGGYGGMGSGFDTGGARSEAVVTYKPVDEFDEAKDTPAFTIYPRRVIVVHGVFPLKEQLELVRRAMRLKTIEEAAQASGNGTGPGPVFAGLEVERRVTRNDGRGGEGKWEPYDHVGRYLAEINSRKIGDQLDKDYLPLFLRYDQMLVTPLPAVGEGLEAVYPDLGLPAVVETVKKMKEANKRPPTTSEMQNKFKGKGGNNPFMPQVVGGGAAGGPAGSGGVSGFLTGGGEGGAGISSKGFGGRMGGMPPAGGPPGMSGSPAGGGNPYGGRMPGAAGPPVGSGSPAGAGNPYGGSMPGAGGPPGMMKGGSSPYGSGGSPYGGPMGYGQASIQAPTDGSLDHLVIRFLDVDVEPGQTYQYRVRVLMKNPNYDPGNRQKKVARPDDANVEILKGKFVEIGLRVTVPLDVNMYAYDPVAYAEEVKRKYAKEPAVLNLLGNREGDLPVVQMQSWMTQVRLDANKREPVGAWVVGDVPAARGEYIGKKTILTLPMWSAEKLQYLLQELAGKVKVAKAKEQPKGMLVDLTTPNLLVDYEGGKVRTFLNNQDVRDEAAVDMLILTPNGLVVKNSAADMANPERADREKKWRDWIAKVEENTKAAGPTGGEAGDGGKPGFGRGSPGGSPGSN